MCCRDAAVQTLSSGFGFESFDGVIRRKGAVGQQLEFGAFNDLKLSPVHADNDQNRPTSPCFESERDSHTPTVWSKGLPGNDRPRNFTWLEVRGCWGAVPTVDHPAGLRRY
jgi:hypothetical protein